MISGIVVYVLHGKSIRSVSGARSEELCMAWATSWCRAWAKRGLLRTRSELTQMGKLVYLISGGSIIIKDIKHIFMGNIIRDVDVFSTYLSCLDGRWFRVRGLTWSVCWQQSSSWRRTCRTGRCTIKSLSVHVHFRDGFLWECDYFPLLFYISWREACSWVNLGIVE